MSDRPNIRIKGFSDTWKQQLLGNIANLYQPTTLSSSQYDDNAQYPVFGANGIIGRYEEFNHDTDQVCISCRGNCGTVNYVKAPVWITGNSMVCNIDLNKMLNKDFFYYALSNLNYSSIITGGAQPQITRNHLQQMELSIPDIEEQDNLGRLFVKLDSLISYYENLYEKTIMSKKYFLQKLFPQKGKDIPEIRFDGFRENWKRKKLGELYKERNEKGNDSLDFLLVSIHTGVTSGIMDGENIGRDVKRSEDKSTYKHVFEGDLVFNMMRAWQGAIGVAKTEGMVSPAYISAIPNDEVYPLFMDYALRRDVVISNINNMSYGITDFRKRLYWDSFANVECLIPSVEEQKKIYDFFNKIDTCLLFHQKRYKELTAIKKYMLQNMFV